MSQYEFGWWKHRVYLKYYRSVPQFEAAYPRFPDLTFAEYVHLVNVAFASGKSDNFPPDGQPGMQTEQFYATTSGTRNRCCHGLRRTTYAHRSGGTTCTMSTFCGWSV